MITIQWYLNIKKIAKKKKKIKQDYKNKQKQRNP